MINLQAMDQKEVCVRCHKLRINCDLVKCWEDYNRKVSNTHIKVPTKQFNSELNQTVEELRKSNTDKINKLNEEMNK